MKMNSFYWRILHEGANINNKTILHISLIELDYEHSEPEYTDNADSLGMVCLWIFPEFSIEKLQLQVLYL